MPRVSILMTVYNAGAYLAPAIESAVGQTFRDFELIVVDDGSNDGSKDVLHAYAAKDPRVRLIDLEKNIGRTPALNRALREAEGDYVAVLDADDIAKPERLLRQVALLDENPDVVLVGTHAQFIDDDGKVIHVLNPPVDPDALRDSFSFSNPIMHSAAMYRRRTAIEVGGYPPNYVYSQDFALWLALLERGRVRMIPEPLAVIRDHSTGSRLTRNPAIAVRRYQEVLQLLGRAQRLPALPVTARRLGRINLARQHFFFAKHLWRAGDRLRAAAQVCRCFLTAPLFCLERTWVRVLLLGKRIRSKLAFNRAGH